MAAICDGPRSFAPPLYQMFFQRDVSLRAATHDNWRNCCGSATGSVLMSTGVDETEDGGVRTDCQREGEGGDQREGRRTPELAHAVPKIGGQFVHQAEPA